MNDADPYLVGGAAIASLPAEVLADTGATGHEPLPSGGSPASSWLLHTPEGPRVIKAQQRAAGRVDGHDLDTFVLKARQIEHLHRHRPRLSPHYVRSLRLWQGADWAAFMMPFVAGSPLADLRGQPEPLLARTEPVLHTLGRFGYDAPVADAPPSYFRDVHEARLRGRAALLRRCLAPALFAPGVRVNGRSCRPALDVLDALRRGPGFDRLITPAGLYFPVHGDLILGNILVDGDRFTVLDPRGTLSPWDVVYDLAKAVFSLTVFEDAIDNGFTIDEGYRFSVVSYRASTADVVAGFLELLARSELGRRLSRDDPHWLTRLALVHAVHCLAESACRLSDPTHREFPHVSGWAARQHLSTGLYLAGLWLINDIAGHLDGDGLDVTGHLRRFCRAIAEPT